MNWNRILSGLLAIAYVVTVYVHDDAESACKIAAFTIIPLACIWFSDAMGGYTGLMSSIPITAPSPGIFVCVVGWILLLLPLIIGVGYALL